MPIFDLKKIKSISRLIAAKTIGVILAAAFLGIAVFLLALPVLSLVATRNGEEVKIVSLSNQIGKVKTASSKGGLYKISVQGEKEKFNGIYCLYPAWPNLLKPNIGDVLRVWPPDHPRVGVAPPSGLGWLLLGTVFVLGLMFLEFAFLWVTIR
jgi:hypothetical protein